jgi:uroporphyrin-3 C-methyltransferase
LLAPDEQQNIRLALSLYLESAQIAVLRDQPLVFKNALQQAQQQLTTYYPDTSHRQELSLALHALQAEAVQADLPDVSRSYIQLNKFLQDKANNQTSDTKVDAGEQTP